MRTMSFRRITILQQQKTLPVAVLGFTGTTAEAYNEKALLNLKYQGLVVYSYTIFNISVELMCQLQASLLTGPAELSGSSLLHAGVHGPLSRCRAAASPQRALGPTGGHASSMASTRRCCSVRHQPPSPICCRGRRTNRAAVYKLG